jgi:hypothetical protein
MYNCSERIGLGAASNLLHQIFKNIFLVQLFKENMSLFILKFTLADLDCTVQSIYMAYLDQQNQYDIFKSNQLTIII